MNNWLRSCLISAPLLVATAAAQDTGVYTGLELRKDDVALIEMSEEFGRRLERRGLLYRDAGLETWVGQVAERLAPPPTDTYIDYRFRIVRDPSPNAFALADGQVYVHTGMLARLENEAQLAGLLAHEINHAAGHHMVLARRDLKGKLIASEVFGGMLATFGGVLGGVLAGLTDAGFALSILGYSRELEGDADYHAFDRMVEAGYDPREMAGVFRILGDDPEGITPRVNTKWSTHPDLADRAREIEERAGTHEPAYFDTLVAGDASFDERVWGLRLLTVRDYIDQDYARTALAMARHLVEHTPHDARPHVALGDAWLAMGPRGEIESPEELSDRDKRRNARNRARYTRAERNEQLLETEEGRATLAANIAQALAAHSKALSIDAGLAPAHRGLAEAHHARGDLEEAGRAYMQYLKLDPDAPDKPIVMERLRTIAAGIREKRSET